MGAAKKRLMPLLGASVLLTGGIGACVLLTGGHGTSVRLTAETTDAAACPTTPLTELAGTACDITGTLSMTAGTLNLTAPPAVGWSETVTGLDQKLSDQTAADETYTVNDATGTAAGWNVTAEATPFTYTTTVGTPHTYTLGTGTTSATFATNGSLTTSAGGTGLMTDTTAPGAACAVVAGLASVCTLPANLVGGTAGKPAGAPVAYPVNLTVGSGATGQTATGTGTAAPLSIYNADALTGLGTIVIGANTGANAADNPVGWWINVPSNTFVGTYTSTVSLNLVAGP